MKKGYLKYSDERNQRFSIKTEIDLQKKEVRKFPIYEDGNAHIDNIYQAQEKLKQFYSNVEICKAWKANNQVVFTFVEGESLLDRYNRCLKDRNVKDYEKLLIFHKKLMIGDAKNACTFKENADFSEWFGSSKAYVGKAGLQFSNFDAIASNIIMRKGKPVFIDYEWIMDFPMPKDLVIYHCIHDMYLHDQEFENFYPIAKAMEFLYVQTDVKVLEESYKNFFEHVICDDAGHSYAKDKYTCLKNVQTMDFILTEWESCAANWQAAVEANEAKDAEIAEVRAGWESCAANWEEAVEANEAKDKEIAEIREGWETCAANWKEAVEANEAKDKEIAEVRAGWESCAANWKEAVEIVEAKDKEIAEIREGWEICAANWKEAVEVVEAKDKEIASIRAEWETCAANWQAAIEANAIKDAEIASIRKEWETCAANWMQSVEANTALQTRYNELEMKYNELEQAYNQVINSKVWQANLKVRKVLGK